MTCRNQNRTSPFPGRMSHDGTNPSFSFWVTVTSDGSTYATGPLSFPSVCPVCNVSEFCQTVGWMKMPLRTELGLIPGDMVLDVDPALPPRKGHNSPHFGGLRAHADANRGPGCHLVWRYASARRRCVRWGPSSLPRKGVQQPPLFGPCLLCPHGRPSQQLLSSSAYFCVVVHFF